MSEPYPTRRCWKCNGTGARIWRAESWRWPTLTSACCWECKGTGRVIDLMKIIYSDGSGPAKGPGGEDE